MIEIGDNLGAVIVAIAAMITAVAIMWTKTRR